MSSCGKDSFTQDVILVKDCTGSYLRVESKDFKVCNLEIVDAFQNGEELTVTLLYLDDCSFDYACNKYHYFERWVEVKDVH